MKSIIIILLFIPLCICAQSIEDIDQFTFSICKTLNEPGHKKSDSARLQDAFNENTPKFAHQFKLVEFSDDLMNKIFLRLQRNCDEYQKIDKRLHPLDPRSDWQIFDTKPVSKISATECAKFFKKYKEFYYFEANGNQTKVSINDGFWIETFENGTTSKLYFKKNDCNFELTFIESNNELRKNFSVTGDSYFYELISIKNEVMTVIVKGTDGKSFYEFKLYPIDKKNSVQNN